MKVVLIGAGNLATQLALAFHKNGIRIIQIYSKTLVSAKLLASQVEAEAINQIEDIITDADFYIFSVKDSVLQDLIMEMPITKGLCLHTAGSIPMSVFKGYSDNFGVFYPFQTFSKERVVSWKNIPIFIEASDEDNLLKLNHLANILSDKVIELTSEKRKYIHLSGVFACNFVNHMYTLSADIIKEADIPFDLLLPLINETCAKVHSLSPYEAQTGPAIRFDENVMNKHLDLIGDENVKQIYQVISQNIHQKHKSK